MQNAHTIQTAICAMQRMPPGRDVWTAHEASAKWNRIHARPKRLASEAGTNVMTKTGEPCALNRCTHGSRGDDWERAL